MNLLWENSNFFAVLGKIFYAGGFLVIGFKKDKLIRIGKGIQNVKMEFWGTGRGCGVSRMRVLLPVLKSRGLPEQVPQKKAKEKESNRSIHFIGSNIKQVNKRLISDLAPVRQQTSISEITLKNITEYSRSCKHRGFFICIFTGFFSNLRYNHPESPETVEDLPSKPVISWSYNSYA